MLSSEQQTHQYIIPYFGALSALAAAEALEKIYRSAVLLTYSL
jgi:hypothetical protein